MSPAEPVRTCVGCRKQDSKSALLRCVAGAEDAAPTGERPVLPDVSGRGGGRGAHLHPTADCLALAERRRAFGRALRVQGSLDLSAVRHHIERPAQQ